MHDAIEGAATGEKLKSELQSLNSKGKDMCYWRVY